MQDHKTIFVPFAVPARPARYSHVTPEMRRRLMDGLTQLWAAALERRRAVNGGSSVAVLDVLLESRPLG